jgi:hypothetical protein
MRPGSKPGANAGTLPAPNRCTNVYTIDTESQVKREVIGFFSVLLRMRKKRENAKAQETTIDPTNG